MYRCHKPLKSCRLVNSIIHTNHHYNYKTPDLSLSRIFRDSIMHNYRSNQSALLTRCGTDFRHQYGIFGGESQTSFTRNATRAGSEEGRLFSQATQRAVIASVFLRLWLADHLGCVWGRTARTMICVQALTFFAILPSRATRPSRSPRFSLCSLEIRQKSRLLCRHKFYRSSAPFFLDLPQEEIMSFSEAICKILGREAAESATKSRKDTEGYWKNKTKNFSESLSSHSDQNVWFSMPSYGAEWKFMS